MTTLTCPICLDKIINDIFIHPQDGKKHPFHQSCINPCLIKKNQCPMCQQEIDLSLIEKIASFFYQKAPIIGSFFSAASVVCIDIYMSKETSWFHSLEFVAVAIASYLSSEKELLEKIEIHAKSLGVINMTKIFSNFLHLLIIPVLMNMNIEKEEIIETAFFPIAQALAYNLIILPTIGTVASLCLIKMTESLSQKLFAIGDKPHYFETFKREEMTNS